MPRLVQLFSARDHGPWDRVLDQIAACGFDGVEGFFGVFDLDDFPAMMAARGLTMPQAHVPLALLEGDFERAVTLAQSLGLVTLIAPWLPPEERPTTAAGWQDLGRRLHAIEAKLRALGLRFAWHNHDFELWPVEGTTGMDILLAEAPGMDWEADLGWVIRAGQSALDWLGRHGGRITSVHLKDISGQEAEAGWADLGHGLTDWAPIFAALAKLPRLSVHVAEHDMPADLGRFLSRWRVAHDALMTVRRGPYQALTHATILCADIARMRDFYTRILDLPEMFVLPLDPARDIHYLKITENQYLELFSWGQGAPKDGPGLHHICLEVTDIAASVAALRGRGLRMCLWAEDGSGLVATDHDAITTGLDGNRQSWTLDPEGNRIEFMQIAPDSLQRKALASV